MAASFAARLPDQGSGPAPGAHTHGPGVVVAVPTVVGGAVGGYYGGPIGGVAGGAAGARLATASTTMRLASGNRIQLGLNPSAR
jgi:hypothetical protein